jgi:histidine triad (HIT) family protein
MMSLTPQYSDLIAHMILKCNELALMHGLAHGYKTQVNTGLGGGQEVFHWHIHIYGDILR